MLIVRDLQLYRLGEYELCRDLFEELIATVDPVRESQLSPALN